MSVTVIDENDDRPEGQKSGIPNIAYSDRRRWTVVYPSYINKNLTLAKGRKIPIKFAIERPFLDDII